MSGDLPPSAPGPGPAAPMLHPPQQHPLQPTYLQQQQRLPPHQQHIQHQQPRLPHPQRLPTLQQQQQQQQQLDASMKLTRGTSCVLCQQRKVRCDKNKPCANCVKAGVECRVIPPQPPRRRKKRLQEKDLIDRLKKYESLLSENGVKFDAIGQDLRSDGQHGDDVDDLENDFEGLKTSPEASVSPSAESQGEVKPGTWFAIHKEFRASEQLLHDSSEDEVEGSTIHRAFDKMFDNQDGFPFVVGGRPAPVTDAHPPIAHIMRLWQIYIDNINPLLKITHVPTIQGQVVEAAARPERAPKNIEALMFAIYIMAITSMEEPDVQRMFELPKKELLGRYFISLQQALVNASFMRVNDPITLQAFLLYLFAIRWFVDPRQVFCMIGVAVRIAQRMGLHRDPGGYGLPPFEVEQRRRLWWAIVGYDRRIGEMTGSTVTALSTGGDCKLPLNVNDSDLHVDGKDLPTPHTGPTEMLFSLARIEMSMVVASNSNRDSFKMNNPDKGSPVAPPNPNNPTAATFRLAGQEGPSYTLDGFAAHIEGTYLKLCDPKIPLHFFTLTMTRQALCKMRIINYLVRKQNNEPMPLKEMEQEDLFLQAIQMIEYDNVVQSSESLQPFKWYSMHHFPFPAYMFLVNQLRIRCSGPTVERAWEAISWNHDLRGLLNNLHSPMHMAFGGLFIKAWDAHVEADRQLDKQPTEPHFLGILRERAEKRKKMRAENRRDPSLEQRPVDFPRPGGSDASGPSPAGANDMMTPPMDPSLAGTTQPVGGPAPPSDTDSMDWSYMYNDPNSFNPFGGFGGFGSPMGGGGMPGMPGMGPMGGPGGNMFGN